MSDPITTETIQRRPEYIERLEKALLEGILAWRALKAQKIREFYQAAFYNAQICSVSRHTD